MRRIPDDPGRGEPIEIEFEGKPVRAYAGENVAVALYASGIQVLTRSLKYHRPRGFFCLEGHCGGCLMRINGVPNLRACMEPCQPGMVIKAQNAFPSPDLDLLEMVDWMFPKGMNHHTMMTGSRLMNAVANKVVRQLSGLGELPDKPPETIPPVRQQSVDIAVIGAGPAGLAAAIAAANTGASVLLVDEHPLPGGSLLAYPDLGPNVARERVEQASAAGAQVMWSTTAQGFFPDEQGGQLVLSGPGGLLRLTAGRTIYATGAYAVNKLFLNNDRPGVLAARAVGRLLVTHGVKPADTITVIGADDYAELLAVALRAVGCKVFTAPAIQGAHGRAWVTGAELDGGKQSCDLIAISTTPAPASEVPRQHGCEVVLDPARGGFRVIIDDEGRTSNAQVFACGDLCGFLGPQAAATAGARTGTIAAQEVLS